LIILPEFMELLNQFNSITNSSKVVSVRRLVSIEYDECCICRQQLKSQRKWFKCKAHKAHSVCVN